MHPPSLKCLFPGNTISHLLAAITMPVLGSVTMSVFVSATMTVLAAITLPVLAAVTMPLRIPAHPADEYGGTSRYSMLCACQHSFPGKMDDANERSASQIGTGVLPKLSETGVQPLNRNRSGYQMTGSDKIRENACIDAFAGYPLAAARTAAHLQGYAIDIAAAWTASHPQGSIRPRHHSRADNSVPAGLYSPALPPPCGLWRRAAECKRRRSRRRRFTSAPHAPGGYRLTASPREAAGLPANVRQRDRRRCA